MNPPSYASQSVSIPVHLCSQAAKALGVLHTCLEPHDTGGSRFREGGTQLGADEVQEEMVQDSVLMLKKRGLLRGKMCIRGEGGAQISVTEPL